MNYQALTIGLADEVFSIIQSLLSLHLHLIPASTTKDASHLLEQHVYHLLIVNIEYLRSVHSSDWLSGIRRISFAPIIVLSDTPEQDTHLIVQLGADVCVSNKYHAMIADLAYAQLRRYTEYNYYSNPSGAEVSAFQIGDIFIDPARCKVKIQGRSVNLRPREFSLLLYFMRNPNIVLSAKQICNHAWGMANGYDCGIYHPIYLLRKQIEPQPKHPSYIQTVRGFGYRFRPYVETCDKCDDNVRNLS